MSDDDEAPPQGPGPGQSSDSGATGALWTRLQRLEQVLEPGVHALQNAQERLLLPAWRRITEGEPRWPVSVAVLTAIALQSALPEGVAPRHRWALPTVAGLLLIGIVAANPKRIDRPLRSLRVASMILIAVIT